MKAISSQIDVHNLSAKRIAEINQSKYWKEQWVIHLITIPGEMEDIFPNILNEVCFVIYRF
jgi:hypothetical protein